MMEWLHRQKSYLYVDPQSYIWEIEKKKKEVWPLVEGVAVSFFSFCLVKELILYSRLCSVLNDPLYKGSQFVFLFTIKVSSACEKDVS